jgi:DNA invertase Pin-like site-specific DNA recombinase
MATKREDVVLIRVSTEGQKKDDQEGTIEKALQRRGVKVKPENWSAYTVKRGKVFSPGNEEKFDKVMARVEAGQIGTIYVESQDRFGGRNSKELFSVLNILQKHGTKLIDLKDDRELTSDDMADELRTFLASQKSLEDLGPSVIGQSAAG